MLLNVAQIKGNDQHRRVPDMSRYNDWCNIDVSNSHATTGDFGKLIPIFARRMLPNQTLRLGAEVLIQCMPFMTNLMHRIKGRINYYFVPDRLIEGTENWDKIIMRWDKALKQTATQEMKRMTMTTSYAATHGLADYFAYPLDLLNSSGTEYTVNATLHYAYNMIFNEHIRNLDVTPEVPLTSNTVQYSYWDKNYFTIAEIMQTRGNMPSVPIEDTNGEGLGSLEHHFIRDTSYAGIDLPNNEQYDSITANYRNAFTKYDINMETTGRDDQINLSAVLTAPNGATTEGGKIIFGIQDHYLNEGYGINLSSLITAVAIMKFQSSMMRIQPRYVQYLEMRYGLAPQDRTLQRPEYIGTIPINVNVIPNQNTGGENTQGRITGQAWGETAPEKVNYNAYEHGVIMGIMEICPEMIIEQGLEKQWDLRTTFDFFTREFQDLPDVAIKRKELKVVGDEATNESTFGWTGNYEWTRVNMGKVTGLLRPSLSGGLATYTLARYFNGTPTLNDTFLRIIMDTPSAKARFLQFPTEPTFLAYIYNRVESVQPTSFQSMPEKANIL